MSKFTDRIDMRFKYTPAASTDIRVSIRRRQRELEEERLRLEAEAAAREEEKLAKVRSIKK